MTTTELTLTPQQQILWSLDTVRERAAQVLDRARANTLIAYHFDESRIDAVVDTVLETTASRYPDGAIPPHSRWRHFEVGDINRWGQLPLPPDTLEQARIATELTVLSVLLDAGAGSAWRYVEAGTGLQLARSEGLGVASMHWYASGAASANSANPLRADGEKLKALSYEQLCDAMQVSAANPLVGATERLALVNALGAEVTRNSVVFPGARLGALFDHVCQDNEVDVADAFKVLLQSLAGIWPSRGSGDNFGDVWPYPGIDGATGTEDLVPFHKLTQWMTYSLVEAWRKHGMRIRNEAALTALAEYRNGGLLIDMSVLVPRDPDFADTEFAPGDPAVVEMRAMTVAVIDIIASLLRKRTNNPDLTLAQVLEGGTWGAGRVIAARLRADQSPPIRYIADGTLF